MAARTHDDVMFVLEDVAAGAIAAEAKGQLLDDIVAIEGKASEDLVNVVRLKEDLAESDESTAGSDDSTAVQQWEDCKQALLRDGFSIEEIHQMVRAEWALREEQMVPPAMTAVEVQKEPTGQAPEQAPEKGEEREDGEIGSESSESEECNSEADFDASDEEALPIAMAEKAAEGEPDAEAAKEGEAGEAKSASETNEAGAIAAEAKGQLLDDIVAIEGKASEDLVNVVRLKEVAESDESTAGSDDSTAVQQWEDCKQALLRDGFSIEEIHEMVRAEWALREDFHVLDVDGGVLNSVELEQGLQSTLVDAASALTQMDADSSATSAAETVVKELDVEHLAEEETRRFERRAAELRANATAFSKADFDASDEEALPIAMAEKAAEGEPDAEAAKEGEAGEAKSASETNEAGAIAAEAKGQLLDDIVAIEGKASEAVQQWEDCKQSLLRDGFSIEEIHEMVRAEWALREEIDSHSP